MVVSTRQPKTSDPKAPGMTTFVVVTASLLVGVWLIETVLFVLSYRIDARSEVRGDAEAPL
jgi:hypothetical protein